MFTSFLVVSLSSCYNGVGKGVIFVDIEINRNYSGMIDALQSIREKNEEYIQQIQQACDACFSFGDKLSKISLFPMEQLQIVSCASDYMANYFQSSLPAFDFSFLLDRISETIRQFNLTSSVEMTNIINEVFRDLPSHKAASDAREKLLDSYLSALELFKFYVPEDTREEIQSKVIEPAKKEKHISIDTLINIASIILTILIFLFEQLSSYTAQQESERQIAALSERNQQLMDELSELGGIIQHLTNEVGELSDQLQSATETSLESPNMDNKPN